MEYVELRTRGSGKNELLLVRGDSWKISLKSNTGRAGAHPYRSVDDDEEEDAALLGFALSGIGSLSA
jgi:hypothetical protein